jgi:glutathione S-transferase
VTDHADLPVLYGSRESGHAYKVALALRLLGIQYEYRDVDLRALRNNRRRDFVQVSPFGEVPVLLDDGLPLAQSNAILIHLARKARRLGGEADLSQVTQWLFWEANRIGFSVPNLRHALVFEPGTPADTIDWLRARARSDLERLNDEFAKKAFLLGSNCTVADIACCAYLFWPDQARLDLSHWPNLITWLSRIRGIPGWAAPYDLWQQDTVIASGASG